MTSVQTRVIGIGNPLMGDDGIGIRVIELLQQTELPAAVELIDGGCGGLSLLPLLECCDRALIIDAADFGGTPGEIRVLKGQELDRLPAFRSRQLSHQPALPELLALASRLSHCPPLTLLLIQIKTCSPGLTLSTPLENSLPRLLSSILANLPDRQQPIP